MPAPSSKFIKVLFLVIILALPGAIYLIMSKGVHHYTKLPYIGPKTAIENANGGYDTNYHKIPYFEFINQDGETVTRDDLLGNVYVTDFFLPLKL